MTSPRGGRAQYDETTAFVLAEPTQTCYNKVDLRGRVV